MYLPTVQRVPPARANSLFLFHLKWMPLFVQGTVEIRNDSKCVKLRLGMHDFEWRGTKDIFINYFVTY